MRTVTRHWMKAWCAFSPELQGFEGVGPRAVLAELRWTEGCSQCGWDVSRHASSRADFPGVRRKCWKMERKWGIWWVDDAKVTHYMLFQEVRLGYFTSWVLKGTGTPRQERVCALRSFSVPRIPRRKYSNRLLILTVCSLNCMFQY